MKKRVLFYLLMCILFQTICFAQEVKNALLIANGEYGKDIGFLRQPVSEARNLKRALESIGFNVTLVENANRESMEDALLTFKEKCEKGGGIAFFHYGGHAVQIDGVNYLLPANTRLDNISQVRFKCVNIENLMDSMRGDSNVVVLDSCRNNPFKSGSRGGATTRGLVAVKKQPHNSIIIYSAHADETAQDGIFTPILTQYITEKNISLEDVLKKVRREVLKKTDNEQYPGEYNQLTESVYLAGKSNESNEKKKNDPVTKVSSKALTGFFEVSAYSPASLYIDGTYMAKLTGSSQERFELPTGVHKIKLKYRDGKIVNDDILIEAGSTLTYKYKYTELSYDFIYSLEASIGYSVQHFKTKYNEISFTTNGLSLFPLDSRFHFNYGFEIKLRSNITFGVKNFDTEKITYTDFTIAILQLGYNYKWFAFHAGIGLPSLEWETVANTENPLAKSVGNLHSFGLKFPIDIEFQLLNWLTLYIEYSPRMCVEGDCLFTKHAINLGMQFKFYNKYVVY